MHLPEKSYSEQYLKRYPLQDHILKLIDQRGPGFYLGGGTALSRFYYNHRYSDDLDFFALEDSDFIENVQSLNKQLEDMGYNVEVFGFSSKFARFHITDTTASAGEAGAMLKVDFISQGSKPRFGELIACPLFSKIDNPRNILSEKITFIHKKSPKDIADVWFICLNLEFEWAEIISEANQKSTTDPLFIAEVLSRFNADELEAVKWIKPVRLHDFQADRETIINDIITKSANSLFNKKE